MTPADASLLDDQIGAERQHSRLQHHAQRSATARRCRRRHRPARWCARESAALLAPELGEAGAEAHRPETSALRRPARQGGARCLPTASPACVGPRARPRPSASGDTARRAPASAAGRARDATGSRCRDRAASTAGRRRRSGPVPERKPGSGRGRGSAAARPAARLRSGRSSDARERPLVHASASSVLPMRTRSRSRDEVEQAMEDDRARTRTGDADQRRHARRGQHAVIDLQHEERAGQRQDVDHAAHQAPFQPPRRESGRAQPREEIAAADLASSRSMTIVRSFRPASA